MRKNIIAVCLAVALGIAPCGVNASQDDEAEILQESESSQEVETEILQESESSQEVETEILQESESSQEVETEGLQESESSQEVENEEVQESESSQEIENENSQQELETMQEEVVDTTSDVQDGKQTQSVIENPDVPEGDSAHCDEYNGYDEIALFQNRQGEVAISQVQLLRSLLEKVGKGYSQSMRYDKNYYDCSSLVLRCLQEFGLSGVPFSTYGWNSLLQGMNVGDEITFHGNGKYVSYKLTAVNTNVIKNPDAFLIPGTIMVLIEPGYSGGHIAVSLGNFVRQDNDLNPGKDAVAIVDQTRNYVASQLAARYGVDRTVLMGTNSISGYLNTWMDSDWLGEDMWKGDSYSGAYNRIWRVEAFNTKTGVCVTNVARGTHGLTAKYVLVPVDTDSKLEEQVSIDKIQISNISPKGYQVDAVFSATYGVSRVLMPTWTEKDGQDDLIWHNATIQGNTASFYVKASEHKNEGGQYFTHIYLYGKNGKNCMAATEVRIPIRQIKDYTGFHTDLDGSSYYYRDGNIADQYTGLVLDQGEWYYIKEGKLEEAYTGLVQHNGDWYYVENGRLNREYTGLTLYYTTWYYVENGRLNWNYTGLTLYYGTWYYVENGRLNWNYTGLTLYYYTWYYVENGRLNWNYTGLTPYYGTWYYVENGRLNWNYTGLTLYYYTWYYVENGRLNWNYTGLTLYYYTWYYVENGRLNWNYTGLTPYYGTWYYVENGRLNWNYTGSFSQDGMKHQIHCGRVVG